MTPIRKRMLEAGAKLGMTVEEMDKRIKEWLDNPEPDAYTEDACPFFLWPEDEHLCDICKTMFPKLKIDGAEWGCPCMELGLSYVRRRAREALEDNP